MTRSALLRDRSATFSSNGPNRSRIALGEPIGWIDMNLSVKTVDDWLIPQFAISLAQTHVNRSGVKRSPFSQQACHGIGFAMTSRQCEPFSPCLASRRSNV